VALREENPQANDAELGEAAENAVQTLVISARRAKERQQQYGPPDLPDAFDVLTGALRLGSRAERPDRRSLDYLPTGRCGEPHSQLRDRAAVQLHVH
jgi:hypothetical protein